MKYRIRLINQFPAGCCGQTMHQELLAMWEFESLEDAQAFYRKYAGRYGNGVVPGEYLVPPELVDEFEA